MSKEPKKETSNAELIQKDLGVLKEKLKEPAAVLSEARARLKNLEKSLAEYESRREGHQTMLSHLLSESVRALESGQKPNDEGIRAAKNALSESEEWILKIQESGIPESREQFQQAEQALMVDVKEKIEPIKGTWTQRMSDLLNEAFDLYELWLGQVDSFYRGLGLSASARSLSQIPRLTVKGEGLHAYLRRIGEFRGF